MSNSSTPLHPSERPPSRHTFFPSRENMFNTRISKIFLQEPDSDNADYTIPISFPRPRKWGRKHESRGFPNRTPEGEDGKNPPLPQGRTLPLKNVFGIFLEASRAWKKGASSLHKYGLQGSSRQNSHSHCPKRNSKVVEKQSVSLLHSLPIFPSPYKIDKSCRAQTVGGRTKVFYTTVRET